MSAGRRNHPLPEAAPSPDDWARLLWPWLDAAERMPRPCLLLARELAARMDGTDRTVDTEAVRPGVVYPGTRFTQRRALATLIEYGMLVAANPGRHRITLPPNPATVPA